MTGQELDEYFERLDTPQFGDDGEPVEPPTPDLSDRLNLTLFHIMQQYKGYPVLVFKDAVENWPASRHKDFTTLMLASGRVRKERQEREQVWEDWKNTPDPPEWGGS